MKFSHLLLGIAILNLIFGNLNAASFDCTRPSSEVERIICTNNELSKLDESMNKAYHNALKQSLRKKQIIESQRQWLEYDRDKCQDTICIKEAYESRIKELGQASISDKTSDESEFSYLFRCEKSLKRITIIETSLIDKKILSTINRMQDDMIVYPYDLTKMYEIKDEGYQKPIKKAYYRCRFDNTEYQIIIAPYIFNSRISGSCGAAPPSISITIIRNGKCVVPDIIFQGDCHDENMIDAVRIDESKRSITLFSGLAVFESHIEKEFPLNSFPRDWYSSFFQKWPSGNPLADLKQGIRTHDFDLVKKALDSGADVNFPGSNDISVLSEIFYGRSNAIRLNKLAEFDEETDRLLIMLIARGASPAISSKNCASIIDFAAGSGAPVRTIRLLLDAGWPKDYQYRLYAGASVGNPELVQEALDHGANPNMPIRGGRYLDPAITQACLHAGEEQAGQQALAALELLLKHGAVIDEGKPGEGGGDIFRAYAYFGNHPNMRPVMDLLIRYASPAARRNSLDWWLKIGVSDTNPERRELLTWLIKRLEQKEETRKEQ